jgi:VanZ family protein
MFPGADKIVHFALYAVLALFVRHALPAAAPRSTLLLTFVGIAAFAAVDEWHQQFIPGRGMEPADWVADVAGAATGVVIGGAMLRRREHST